MCRIGVNSSLNIWQNFLVKPPRPEDSFLEGFWITNSISLIIIWPFNLCILYQLSCSCVFSFHLSCQVNVCRNVHSTLVIRLMSLASTVISYFITDSHYLFFSLYIWKLKEGKSLLCLPIFLFTLFFLPFHIFQGSF